jgi:hypothetical protein
MQAEDARALFRTLVEMVNAKLAPFTIGNFGVVGSERIVGKVFETTIVCA